MKHLYIVIVYIIILNCNTSCTLKEQLVSLENDFPDFVNVSIVDSINLETNGLFLPYSVFCFDSCFVFTNIRTKNVVTTLDRNSNNTMEVLSIGEGANEVLQFIPVLNNEKRFLFADRVRKKIFELNLHNEYNHTELLQFNDSINRFFSLAKINATTVIGTGIFDKGRFLIYDLVSHNCSYFGNYPENEDVSSLNPYQKAALYAGTQTGIHPNGEQFVLIYNGLIDFYRINSQNIGIHVQAKYYHFPLFAIPSNGPVIAHRKEEKKGFISICNNSKYIYLLYSDTSLREKGSEAYSGNKIFVFDWSGKPIKYYQLDRNILSISMDDDFIWGIDVNHSFLAKYHLIE